MMPNPFAQNPFFSMLGQMPQFGQMQGQQPQFGQQGGQQFGQQPQGPFGAARWLPGFLGQQGGGFGQQGGFAGGLAPWDYQVPTPEYIASFLASRPSVPQSPVQAPQAPRQRNRAGPGPDRDRSGVGGRAGSRSASRDSRDHM